MAASPPAMEQQLPEESGAMSLGGTGGDENPSDTPEMRSLLLVGMTDEELRAFLAPVVPIWDHGNEQDARSVSLSKRLKTHLGKLCGWRGLFHTNYFTPTGPHIQASSAK